MGFLSDLVEALTGAAADKWTDSLSKDYRNDPVYKKKLQELIERGRQLEDETNDKRS